MGHNASNKYIRTAAGLLLFYAGVKYALPLVAPFIAGLCAAAAVHRPAELLASRIRFLSERTCRIILTAALIFTLCTVFCMALCSVVEGAVSFCPGIPEHLERIKRLVSDASAGAQGAGSWNRFVSFVAAGVNWCMDFLAENYRQYLPSVLGRSTKIMSGLPSLLTATVFAVLAALFAGGDYERIRETVKSVLPPETVRTVSAVLRTTVMTFSALTKTYGIILLITFAELTIGLGIMSLTGRMTGNVITIALIISLIDILPVLGTGTVLIPWGLFELISGRTASGIMLIAMFTVIELVRNLIEPRLIAGRLELHPFFTLLGVYAGAKLFGAVGIFVMPPAMMIFREIMRNERSKADAENRS